ncbi:MAG TPA: exodeoxyribonuclease VII small subunit [Thermoflexales bacterium]|nr:exodeoxyribonuclease VII small subunit [Thermoflexales bacterium]HQW34923.1 exodeoxyribonuclease VII small subunit [Thermoflexales bacterium]HRA01435.1 exodeoxyribonuclease VII small subunit [Thermoflexales bacterium]
MSKKTSPALAGADEIETLTFEQAFAELNEIVSKLEDGELPLEQAMELHQRGQKLSARCAELLEKAELTLKVLEPK